MALVHVSSSLRDFTQGQSKVQIPVEGTIFDLLLALDQAYPGIWARIADAQGQVNRYTSVFVNNQSIRALQEEKTPVKEHDSVHIIPAMAGG